MPTEKEIAGYEFWKEKFQDEDNDVQREIREVLIAERKDLIVTISDVSQRLVLLMKWKKDLDKKLGIMELTKDVVH